MSVEALADVNLRLIRSAVTPQVEDDEPEDALADFLGGTGTNLTVEFPEQPPGSWSTAQPFEYRQTIDWIKQNVFGGSPPSGMSTFITAFARGWGEKLFDESGGQEEGGRWPTFAELLKRDDFQNGVSWLPFVRARLPSVFTTEGENGQMIMGTSDPLTGVEFREIRQEQTDFQRRILQGDTGAGPASFEAAQAANQETSTVDGQEVGPSGSSAGEGTGGVPPTQEQREVPLDAADRAKFGGAPTATTGGEAKPAGLQDFLKQNPEVGQATRADPLGGAAPHVSSADLQGLLQQAVGSSGSGRRGSSGSSRRELVFDKASLLEQVEQLYEGWLFEGAPEEQVNRIVDGYIREASSFWSKKGGQLEFDTYVREQLRGLPRHRHIFRHKPEHLAEEEYIGRFAPGVAQLGLRPETTRRETVSAMTSGGSPTEQLRRVARSREAQGSRAFSRELASTLQGLGSAVRF